MDSNKKNPDILENLFRQIPEEELPVSFRLNVMRQITQEAAKRKKRGEWFGLVATIGGAILMLSLAISAFVYLDLPKIEFPQMDFSTLQFYIYIGFLSLLLLLIDHKLRKRFRKDEYK